MADRASQFNNEVNFAQYADLYRKWRAGLLLDTQVVNKYGKELLAYFEAQFAMGDVVAPSQLHERGECQLQPLEAHGYVPTSRYETIYAL